MILRHRVRSVLIVCPSSLQVQWQEEMRDKFGLEFRIIDSEAISNLRRKRGIHVNPWSHLPGDHGPAQSTGSRCSGDFLER